MYNKNYDNEKQSQVAWDARQYFCMEIVYRIRAYLDVNIGKEPSKLLIWFDRLRDLHSLVRAWYRRGTDELIEQQLKEIREILLRHNTGKNKLQDYEHVDQKIHDVFNLIMRDIKKAGLLIPEKEDYDEIEAFKAQFD